MAELKVRVNQMDISRREDPVPPTSIIAVTKPDAKAAPVEDVNYVQQGGSPNRSFNNNNYHPKQGAVITIIMMGTVLTPTFRTLATISCKPVLDLI